MPLYDYVCPLCGHCEEVLQTVGAEAPYCPTVCGCSVPMHRVYGAVPVIFKGPGFYSTDNRKESGDEPVSAE